MSDSSSSEQYDLKYSDDENDENDAREILSKAAGVSIIDDRANNRFPTPLDATVGGCTTSTQSTLELESA